MPATLRTKLSPILYTSLFLFALFGHTADTVHAHSLPLDPTKNTRFHLSKHPISTPRQADLPQASLAEVPHVPETTQTWEIVLQMLMFNETQDPQMTSPFLRNTVKQLEHSPRPYYLHP